MRDRTISRVSAGVAPTSDELAPSSGFGRPLDAVHSFRFTRDGRTLYFQEGKAVYSVAMPSGGGTPPPRKRIAFSPKIRIDRPAEWAQMFDDAWRTMKYRFYDPKMHGHDWDAMRAKYRPLVEHIGDRQELLNIVNDSCQVWLQGREHCAFSQERPHVFPLQNQLRTNERLEVRQFRRILLVVG